MMIERLAANGAMQYAVQEGNYLSTHSDPSGPRDLVEFCNSAHKLTESCIGLSNYTSPGQAAMDSREAGDPD